MVFAETVSVSSGELWPFVKAVFRHWVKLMGGCLAVVLLGVFEKVTGRDVPLSAYVTVLVGIILWGCYLAWRDSKKRVATLSEKVADLEERVRPKLKILYNDGEFNHDECLNGQIIGRIVRLGIYNDSDGVVNGVRVEAHGFINGAGTLLPPQPLQITNDLGNLKANGFSINPRHTQRVELIKKAADGSEMYLATSVSGVNAESQADQVPLLVSVSGETSPQRQRVITVRVNAEGLLEVCKQQSSHESR